MTALARLADDVAVLVRDGDAVLLRDGAEVLHVPGAGPAAEWLAGWSTRPWPRRELAGAPTAVRHLLALLERHGAVLADPLTGHLLDLHGRTVGGHLELPAVPGADSAFLAREAGTGPIVRLPPPAPGAAPLGRALRDRRSAGRFGTGPVPLAVLGTLLGAGAGTTGTADAGPETNGTAGLPAAPNGTADTHAGPNGTAGLPAAPNGTAGLPAAPNGTAGLPAGPNGTADTPAAPNGTADTHAGPNGTAGADPGGSTTPGGGAGGVVERVGGAAGSGWAEPGRAYPSGGRLYPVETHVVAVRVAGLPAAGYRYLPLAHALSRRAAATPMTEPARWLPDLPPGDTAAVVLLTVDFARPSLARYGGRAYRLALLEAGQIAQNLLLLGTVLGVAGRPYCGYDEEAAAGAAGLAYPTETVVYAIAFGPAPDTPDGGRTAEPVPPDGRS